MEVVPTQVDVRVVVGGSGLVVQTILDRQQSVVNKTHKLLQVEQVELVAMVVEEEDLIFSLVHELVRQVVEVLHLQVVVDLLAQLRQVAQVLMEKQVRLVVSGVKMVVIHRTQVMGVMQEQRYSPLDFQSQVQ